MTNIYGKICKMYRFQRQICHGAGTLGHCEVPEVFHFYPNIQKMKSNVGGLHPFPEKWPKRKWLLRHFLTSSKYIIYQYIIYYSTRNFMLISKVYNFMDLVCVVLKLSANNFRFSTFLAYGPWRPILEGLCSSSPIHSGVTLRRLFPFHFTSFFYSA